MCILSGFTGLNGQPLAELLAASHVGQHPVLVMVSDLGALLATDKTIVATHYHFWFVRTGRRGPVLCIVRDVPCDTAWAWHKYWLTSISSPDYDFDLAHSPLRAVFTPYRSGLSSIKEGVSESSSRPSSAGDISSVGSLSAPSSSSTKQLSAMPSHPLAQQLSIVSELPQEERFQATFDMIYSFTTSQGIDLSHMPDPPVVAVNLTKITRLVQHLYGSVNKCR